MGNLNSSLIYSIVRQGIYLIVLSSSHCRKIFQLLVQHIIHRLLIIRIKLDGLVNILAVLKNKPDAHYKYYIENFVNSALKWSAYLSSCCHLLAKSNKDMFLSTKYKWEKRTTKKEIIVNHSHKLNLSMFYPW